VLFFIKNNQETMQGQTILRRLKRLHAEYLGLYMARRLMGETGEVQKKRLLWLAQKINIYERE
jgi:hypothetical protein